MSARSRRSTECRRTLSVEPGEKDKVMTKIERSAELATERVEFVNARVRRMTI